MNRKNLRTSLASLIVFVLVGVMFAAASVSAFTNNKFGVSGSTNSAIQAEASSDTSPSLDSEKAVKPALKATDKIGYIVELDGTSLIDVWLANPQGYETFAEYRSSTAGRNAAENLINKQNAVFNKIARQADVELKYNYVNIMNGFAIEITYGDRELISSAAAKANAVTSYVSERYMVPDAGVAVENAVNAYDTGIFNSEYAREKGYAGQNSVVAILDTGLDYEHVAFDPNHPLFDLKTQQTNKTLRFTKETLAKKVQDLTVVNGTIGSTHWEEGSQGEIEFTPTVSVDELYYNEKVVYTYDYSDRDTEVNTHIENAHGTHVAGIIAGHSDDPFKDTDNDHVYFGYKKDGEKGEYTSFYAYGSNGQKVEATNNIITVDNVTINVADHEKDIQYDVVQHKPITGITGVAPQAQLAIFKVFSDFDQGAPTEALFSALEDCVVLGVDVINMSLGSDCGFQEESDTYRSSYEAYEAVKKSGISLIVAASNSNSSNFGSHYGLNLTSNPDAGTVGSPASYDAAFTVASISGVKSKYLLATDGRIGSGPSNRGTEYGVAYYYESVDDASNPYDFMEEIYEAVEKNDAYKSYLMTDETDGHKYLKIPYVTLPGVGSGNSYVGKNVSGKIVLVSRGDTSFEQKVEEARNRGAIACIIFNNAAGMLRMQVGDNAGIPSCSISMDAAANIKDKDISGPAYFIIDDVAEAGPFISEFSSWGPIPNLLLKPDITAHGGEIYSSIPGDPFSYDRFSGTSMACPNMAGVVTLLRQYMKDLTKGNVNDKFGIKKEGTIDDNLMEQRIYQILMSTATIANNEEGNPYSPRKQGAGLADLTKSLNTEQYLYVMEKGEDGKEVEKDRTKIELLDDPDRNGEYTMEFYVRNVSTTEQRYKLNGLVFTEGISTDGKTVNEKAHLLEAYTPTLTIQNVNNGTLSEATTVNFNGKTSAEFQVNGNSSVKITYSIKLGAEDINWLEQFANGMYVEGYVCLDNLGEKTVDLNIPFLAFYGDWGDAPFFDYDIYETTKDLHDDNIDDDDKRYSSTTGMRLIGKVLEAGNEYSIPLGSFIFSLPENYDGPDATEDKCAISLNTNGSVNGIWCASGLLRGAKRVFWKIEDALTGELMISGIYNNGKKSQFQGSSGGIWVDVDAEDCKFVNNAKYTFSLYPVLDWKCEDFINITDPLEGIQKVIDYNVSRLSSRCTCSDVDACIKDRNCQDEDCGCASRNRYYWSSSFWVDSDSPFISNARVRAERDRKGNVSYYLDLYLTDNHYIMGMQLDIYDKDEQTFISTFDPPTNTVQPLETDRNATTLFTYNLTPIWDQIRDGINYRLDNADNTVLINANPQLGLYPTQIRIQLYDYAFNKSFFTIDLMDLMEGANTSLAFGDIGNYTEYGSGDDKISVLYSVNDTITTLENGNYKRLNSLTLVQGQRFPVEKAVIESVTTAYTGWPEDLAYRISSITNSLIFDDESHEIYAVAPGDATVTVSSRKGRASAQLSVKVLSDDEVAKYNVNVSRHRDSTNISGLWFDEGGKIIKVGDTYELEAHINPWFADFDTDKYAIVWETDDPSIATVKANYKSTKPGDEFKATITANSSRYIQTEADDKTPILDAQGNEKEVIWVYENNKLVWKTMGDNGQYVEYKGHKKFIMNNDGYATITATVVEKVENPGNNVSEMLDDEGKHLFYYRTTINTSSFTVGVDKEFVVEGNVLNEYHGKGGDIVMPDDINITSTANTLFFRRGDITSIRFPEGLTIVSYATCAYMENLERVILPSTLQKIDMYAFTASYDAVGTLPRTKLSIVDFSACAKPIQVNSYAFLYQRYLGVDMAKSTIVDDGGKGTKNDIYLISDYDKIFDLKMVRTAYNYAFYELKYIKKLDLTGLRSVGTATFYSLGSDLKNTHEFKDLDDTALANKYSDCHTTIVSGDGTNFGEAAFVGSGIGEIVINAQRVSAQAFVGSTVELSDGSYQGIDGDVLKKVTFTSEHLIIEEGAFAYSNIEEVEFQGSVDYIGDGAFVSSKLKTIKFAEGKDVKYIGYQAFSDTMIEEIKLPQGLTTLKDGAFLDCSKLKKITIDDKCALETLTGEEFTAYGAQFGGCNITEITVEENNAYFKSQDGVLYNKDMTKVICVPSKIVSNNNTTTGTTTVASNVVDANGKFTLPSSVKTIGAYAFSGSDITEIDLAGVETIEYGAFYACKSLTKVTFPNTITEIPDGTFYNCEKLTTVTFGEATDGNASSLNRIGRYAFYGCAFKTINLPNMANKTENVDGKNVTTRPTIGELAFAENRKLTTFNWPTNVTTLEGGMFYYCEALKSINGVGRVTSIGDQAFTMASALEKADFVNATSVGFAAFAGTAALKSFDLSKVLTIGDYAFSPAARNTASGGTEYVTVLGQQGNVNLNRAVRSIGADAFAEQNVMYGSFNLNASCTIGDRAFYNCNELIVTASNATSIGEYAFAFTASDRDRTSEQATQTIGSNVNELASSAFEGANIKSFSVNSNNNYMADAEGVLYKILDGGQYELVAYPAYKDDATEYTVREGTVRIDNYAFAGSQYLVKVNIPASVKAIGKGAFLGSNVMVYNFLTLNAPELETDIAYANPPSSTVSDGEDYRYFWQVYNNFNVAFNFVDENTPYKYRSLRQYQDSDTITSYHNTSYLGGGFSEKYSKEFNMILLHPSNASGFDSFIWSNYFDNVMLTAELLEDSTVAVMDLIRALPAPDMITLNDSLQVTVARSRYNNIKSYEQRQFIQKEGLVDVLEACEAAISRIQSDEASAINAVVDLIKKLPAKAQDVTADDRANIEAARAAYNALSATAKATFDSEQSFALQRLVDCEEALANVDGGEDADGCGNCGNCGSCGTITFGSGSGFGGGIGLIVGLTAVLLACLAIVLIRKKKPSTDK